MPVTPTPVSALPDPPSTDDLTNFDTEADSFIGAFPTLRTEINALATNVYNNAMEAVAANGGQLMTFTTSTGGDPGNGKLGFNSGGVASSATLVNIDELNAAGQSIAAYLDSIGTTTSAIKAYLTVRQASNGAFAMFAVTSIGGPAGYRQIGVTYLSGSGTFTDAALIGLAIQRFGDAGTNAVNYAARATTTTLAIGDVGKFIDYTSGAGAMTVNAASTYGAGFWVWVRNSQTVAMAAVTADGVAQTLRPGDAALLLSDGSSWRFTTIRRGNWSLLATTTVGSPVATVAFTGIAQTWRNLALEVRAASHNNGSNTTLGFSFTPDGTTWSGPYLPSDSIAAAGSVSGKVAVTHYASPNWLAYGGAFSAAQAGGVYVVPNGAALTGIRAQFAAGSIDAGTFELWGE